MLASELRKGLWFLKQLAWLLGGILSCGIKRTQPVKTFPGNKDACPGHSSVFRFPILVWLSHLFFKIDMGGTATESAKCTFIRDVLLLQKAVST